MVTHIMKTTLDLPDHLLIEAKAVAARRRTTLKDMVTRSLRREIGIPEMPTALPSDSPFEIGELGYLVIKKRPGSSPVTPDAIRVVQDEIEGEDLRRTTNPVGQ